MTRVDGVTLQRLGEAESANAASGMSASTLRSASDQDVRGDISRRWREISAGDYGLDVSGEISLRQIVRFTDVRSPIVSSA